MGHHKPLLIPEVCYAGPISIFRDSQWEHSLSLNERPGTGHWALSDKSVNSPSTGRPRPEALARPQAIGRTILQLASAQADSPCSSVPSPIPLSPLLCGQGKGEALDSAPRCVLGKPFTFSKSVSLQ